MWLSGVENVNPVDKQIWGKGARRNGEWRRDIYTKKESSWRIDMGKWLSYQFAVSGNCFVSYPVSVSLMVSILEPGLEIFALAHIEGLE